MALGLSILANTLWRQLSRKVSPADFTSHVHNPILSAQQITELAGELAHLSIKPPVNPLNSQALRQGEQSSRFMGAGLEYEESRPYQVGDEIRRINWQLMAKTGHAFTKLYQEERQENSFILLDHRQTMRFGTRTRLKAEQALRAAGYYLWMAQQAGTPVEGVRLAETVTFTPTFEGRSSFEQMMARFSQPCPPIQHDVFEPHLNDVLLDLTHRIQPGSRLILISDFHDLNQKSVEILTALTQLADIQAIWVQDPAERSLPNQSSVQLQSMVNGQHYSLSDTKARAAYQAWSLVYFAKQQAQLKAAGVTVKTLLSDAPLSVLQRQGDVLLEQGEQHG
ncbi:MAG: DUF58 domain-containing protein [Thiotrichales bacterium]|nr:DUF58 domain-containing protein [Thiotrichales bacterium]